MHIFQPPSVKIAPGLVGLSFVVVVAMHSELPHYAFKQVWSRKHTHSMHVLTSTYSSSATLGKAVPVYYCLMGINLW